MYRLLILFLLISSSIVNAQDLALEVGYKHKHTNSAAIGLNYMFYNNDGDFSSKGAPFYINGAITGLTDFNDDHAIMGGVQAIWGIYELGLNYSTENDLEPTLGINIINGIRMNVGYNIAFEGDNNMTFNLTLLFGEWLKIRTFSEEYD